MRATQIALQFSGATLVLFGLIGCTKSSQADDASPAKAVGAARLDTPEIISLLNTSEMVANLRDPGSAQYRALRAADDGWLCGELNAKNGMGGYVGFTKFIYNAKGGPYLMADGQMKGNLGPKDEEAITLWLAKTYNEHSKLRKTNPEEAARIEAFGLDKIAENVYFLELWEKHCK